MKAMAEIKSFAGDAYWAVIDEVQTACRTPAQRRWYAGVTIYLLFAFLAGNAMSEMWNVYLNSMA
jgi:hypothetical protein